MSSERQVVLAKPAVEIIRVVKFPLERVWGAWTDPGKFARWWPGEGLVSTGITADVRVGGEFSWGLRRPENGNTYLAKGRFEEIVEHERFVLSWDSVRNGEDYVTGARVSISFRALDAGSTQIRIFHEFLDRAEMCEHYSTGWASAIEKLAVYLDVDGNVPEELGEAQRALHFNVEIAAKPEQIWSWLTDAAKLTQWFPQEAEIDPRPGGRYSFRWNKSDGSCHERSATITAVEQPLLLEMEWFPTNWDPQAGSEQEWLVANRTLVSWKLSDTGDGSSWVQMSHSGWQYGDEELDKMFRGHADGWQEYVTNLKEVAEGRGDIR